jgi:hypothetical protein
MHALGRASTENEARRVPHLGGEVAPAGQLGVGKPLVAAGGGAHQQREAHGIGSDVGDDGQRIDHVALGLAHLLAGRVADDTVQVDGVEGLHAGAEKAQHHHPGNPEEEDVVPGLHHRGRVEAREVGRLLWPTQRRERPQPAAEPGVEDVGLLGQLGCRPAAFGAGIGPVSRIGHGDMPVRAVPRRDAMAPPQLPAHRPVVDVLHPVGEHLLEVRRQDAGTSLAHAGQGLVGQGLDADEPLHRQPRLDDRAAALAAANHHLVRLLALQVAHGLQPLDHGGTSVVAVHAGKLAGGIGEPRVLVQDADDLQAVATTDLVVVEVVGGGDLHGPGAELPLHVRVGHDGQAAAQERQDGLAPDQAGIALVVGVHRDAGVSEDCLRPCRGHADPGVGVRRAVGSGQVVADGPQRAGLFVLDVLEVADRGAAARTPVDQRLAAIGQAGVPKPLECHPHRPRAYLVHGEAQPRPVQARPQPAVLLADEVARLVHEPPHAL